MPRSHSTLYNIIGSWGTHLTINREWWNIAKSRHQTNWYGIPIFILFINALSTSHFERIQGFSLMNDFTLYTVQKRKQDLCSEHSSGLLLLTLLIWSYHSMWHSSYTTYNNVRNTTSSTVRNTTCNNVCNTVFITALIKIIFNTS